MLANTPVTGPYFGAYMLLLTYDPTMEIPVLCCYVMLLSYKAMLHRIGLLIRYMEDATIITLSLCYLCVIAYKELMT